MASDTPTIRRFTRADAAETARLYYDAVREGAASAYTDEQRAAWAPAVPAPQEWADLLGAMTTLVAEEDGAILGFISLTDDGHIDRAFVRPDRMGTGIAGMLYDALEARAKEAGFTRLTTDASELAKPLFMSRGWTVVRRQSPVRQGVHLVNYAMEKRL